jgi:hypothetical protein
MLKIVSLLLAGACLALGATPAFADWTTTIEPVADGRGNAAILLGEADEGRWIQLWCRGQERRLAILVNDGQNDEPGGVTATFRFAADTGSSWSSVGDFYRHADSWLGFSYRNLADFEGIVRDIIYADGNIAATIDSSEGFDDDVNVVASAKGSTKAGREFATFCFGAVPASPFSETTPVDVAPELEAATGLPEQRPAAGQAAWVYATAADPNGGTEASLVADLDQGGYLYAYCDGQKQPSLAFVSRNRQTFPDTGTDQGLRVYVLVDGQETIAAGEYFSLDADTQGILFGDVGAIESLMHRVGDAQGDVAVMLDRTSSPPMTTRWPAINLDGLQQGAAQFIAHCWGSATPAAAVPAQPAIQPAQPAPQPAQPVMPAQPVTGGVWQTADLSGDTSSRYTVEMTASAENADATLRFACAPATALMTVGIFDRRGFAGDGAYEVTATIDQRTWTLARTTPERASDGRPGVVSSDAQVLDMIDQLSVAKQTVRIDLVHAMGAKKSYRFNANGSINPATDAYFGCRP